MDWMVTMRARNELDPKGQRCEEVSTDIEDLQRMRNKASTDVSNASTDNIHQRISASTDKASIARASTDKAING
ncbi:hypothetical protein AgCh_022189 [Apium graveolens]